MKPKIYLHIGFHKTATTTIQRGLFLNQEKLKKTGWLYPKSGLIWNLAHHNLSFELYDDPRYLPEFGGLEDLSSEVQQAQQKNIIISSEDFGFRDEKTIKLLHEKLIGITEDITIIVYVRRQDKWLYSAWSEVVKYPTQLRPFEAFIKNTDKGFFYEKLIPWAELFGQESIRVRVLEKGQLQGNVFEDFLATCDLPEVNRMNYKDTSNVSPGYKTLEVIRAFGKRYGRAYIPFENSFPFKIARLIEAYSEEAGWNVDRKTVVDRVLFEKIMDRYAESNQKLAREYLGREKLFFEEFQESEIDDFDFSEMSSEEMMDLMVYILKSFNES